MQHTVLNAYVRELESRDALLQAQLAREERERVRALGAELPAAARAAAARVVAAQRESPPLPSPANVGNAPARPGDGAPARP